MQFQQFTNENTGLSFYDEPKEVTAGLSGVDFGGIVSDADFKAVYSAIALYIGMNAEGVKKALVVGSYVPDMLRLYMNTVRQERKAFQWADYNTYWMPLYIRKGFDKDITGLFFKKFEEMHTQGLVPRNIWYPDPRSSGDNGSGSNGVYPTNGNGLSTGAMLGIGAGVIALIGTAYFIMK